MSYLRHRWSALVATGWSQWLTLVNRARPHISRCRDDVSRPQSTQLTQFANRWEVADFEGFLDLVTPLKWGPSVPMNGRVLVSSSWDVVW